MKNVAGPCGILLLLAVAAVGGAVRARGAEAAFAEKPAAAAVDGKTRITFAVAAPTDVEVAVLNAQGGVVRQLAAGALGGGNPPPEPLRAGLRQELVWDGRDDFGKAAAGGPFKIRVRAGLSVKFGRFIGAHPMAMGVMSGVAADSQGNAYVMSLSHAAAAFKQIVKVDAEGCYVRTVLPFAADLPPDRVSAWARHDGTLRPINRNAAGPEFYTRRSFYHDPVLSLLPANDGKRLFLTDGAALYQLGFDGGMVDGRFELGKLWGRKALPNSGDGPVHLAPSPDGRYLYYAGPFSSDNKNGYKADPDFPPGRVYRMEIGKGFLEPFVTLPVAGQLDGYRWTGKHIKFPQHYTVPHGPVHGVAAGTDGRVFVADQDGGRVAVFDAAGKLEGEALVACPDVLAVHPKTGALYVLAKEIVGYGQYRIQVLKFLPGAEGWKKAAPEAVLDLGLAASGTPGMTLAVNGEKSILWVSGMRAGLGRIEDRGGKLELLPPANAAQAVRIENADRMAVDPATDEIYINNAYAETRRFNGQTGAGGEVVLVDKKGVLEAAVGLDGYLYLQVGPSFSGSLGRYTRDLRPAPYPATGTHLLTPFIYGASKPQVGYRERGIGVGRDGKVYALWMFGGWCLYGVTAWGPDGRPLNGARAAVEASFYKQGLPAELKQALIAPLGTHHYGGMYAGACIRADSRGRIYVGVGVQPKGRPRPAGFETDAAYDGINGSIVRFSPQGGGWGRTHGVRELAANKQDVWFEPAPVPAGALEANGGNYFTGADMLYGGFGPMSSKHGDVAEPLGHSCSCRGGRFEIDGYDRLYIPNPVANSVRICDNNGNTICEFGAYGNFDSQWVPPDSKDGRPLVAVPAIPLGWPVGVGCSERSVYIADQYNRRIVRVDRQYAAEAVCEAP